MVHPGAFGFAQNVWLSKEMPGYAVAFEVGLHGDQMKDIIRQFFCYFSLSKDFLYQPTAEELAVVDVHGPSAEIIVPEPTEEETLGEYEIRLHFHVSQAKTFLYRKGVSPF